MRLIKVHVNALGQGILKFIIERECYKCFFYFVLLYSAFICLTIQVEIFEKSHEKLSKLKKLSFKL